jgi:hypothetical protein
MVEVQWAGQVGERELHGRSSPWNEGGGGEDGGRLGGEEEEQWALEEEEGVKKRNWVLTAGRPSVV